MKLDLATAILQFFGFLVALTAREGGKAHVAKWQGDISPETTSRATFNPIPHIDIFGTIIFPLVMLISGIPLLIGWAKPVMFDARYFKHLKKGLTITYASGAFTNFLIACACGVAIRVAEYSKVDLSTSSEPIPRILYAVAVSNLVIGIFNLIPLPNTDGWNLIITHAKYNVQQTMEKYAMHINIIMLMMFLFGGFSWLFAIVFGMFELLFVV
jgi:Zn-dependent protease